MEVTDLDLDNYEFVYEISKRLVLEGRWDDLKLLTLPGIVYEVFFGTKLKTHFQLGDHAAMLLMREIEVLSQCLHSAPASLCLFPTSMMN